MPEADPWSDIPKAISTGSRNERRADPEHPLDFYRARDELGRCMLILKGDHLQEIVRLPSLAGVAVHQHAPPQRPAELILELRDLEQLSIFRALAADILEATSDVAAGDALSGARRLITRVERWQELLKRRKDQILSRHEIIGLVGELLFLRDRVFPRLPGRAGIAAWRGCYRDEQDFAVGSWIIEIKTQLSTADQYLKISSEAQLDTSSGPIALCHQTLTATGGDEPRALTLNELVASIRQLLLQSAPAAIDLFEAALIAGGYDVRPDYDEEAWLPIQLRIFEVAAAFPRLVAGNIPTGVQAVAYRILLNACAEFQRDDAWLNQTVFHDHTA